jgi:hypothetical protein
MRDQLNDSERDEVIADIMKELENHSMAAEHRTEAPRELT